MNSVIIAAGGQGTRLAGPVRKQYLAISGRPILSHTLNVFGTCKDIHGIIIVVPSDDIDFCKTDILPSLKFQKKIIIMTGGVERQHSVYNGITAIKNPQTDDVVLIHDAVRPFVTPDQICSCIAGAKTFGACILGIPAADTLKRLNNDHTVAETLNRNSIWLAQTPQAFQYGLIMKAHEKAKKDSYTGTDDASLVERLGQPVKIINGSRHNIKITTPEDLILAEAIFAAANT